jgi:hypothetical protein
MKNQLFKTPIESTLLWEFLKSNMEEREEFYILSKPLYKKAVFNNTINVFIYQIEDFYFDSKKYYIRRKLDYIKFATIIRQISNSLNIKYKAHFLYNNSSYEIIYYIYKPVIEVQGENNLPVD